MEDLQEIGIGLIQALQQLSPALDGMMHFFSFMGRTEFYLLILPLIYWVVDNRLGIRMLFILLVTETVGATLKLVFHQPRPYWIGDVKALAEEISYGIPSTHSSDSLAVWGYLAHRVKKTWIWITALALILLISFSRLYLGVHFPHDVVAGWLIGGVVLWIFAACESPASTWIKQRGTPAQIGVGFTLSVLLILVVLLTETLISTSPDPAAWSAFATQARTPAFSFTYAGALFGTIAGYALMKQYAHFRSDGKWSQRAGRYGFGILGVLLIYSGLDVLFSLIAADEIPVGYALRYIRYALVTLWVTFIAPWIFLKIGLAKRQSA